MVLLSRLLHLVRVDEAIVNVNNVPQMGDNTHVIFRILVAWVAGHIEHLEIAEGAQVCDGVNHIADEVVAHRQAVEVLERVEVLEVFDAVVEQAAGRVG